MQTREQIYQEIFERIKCSEKDWRRINSIKTDFEFLVEQAFHNDQSYVGLKFIGSTETGHALKWIRDIDCVIALYPYDSNNFVSRINSLKGEIDDLKVR